MDENKNLTEDIIKSNEFVNEDNEEAFRLLGLKSKISDIESIADGMDEQQRELLQDGGFDYIDTLVNNYTEEELTNMSSEEIDKLLVEENGEPVQFAFEFDNKKDFDKFKRDFVILRKQTLETFKKFDEEIENINKEIAESQEEFDEYSKTFGNITNLIRYTLEKRLNEADTDDKKEIFNMLIESFNNGFNLDNVKKYCRSYKGKDIISSYRVDKTSHYIYRKYLKVIESLKIKTDLTKFINLEKSFLSEEYHKRANIFMFAIIHYIASWHNKKYTKADGLFITQFTINIKNLFYDKFDTEEDKMNFIHNIEEVINIIG